MFYRFGPLAIFLAALSIVVALHHPRTVFIQRTPTGFIPQNIVINKGDTVVFTSTTGHQFWPASNDHPTHGLYPEFDPKRPVGPNDSWTFKFDRAGTWGYHDHLASQIRGVILVRGYPGEINSLCQKRSPNSANLPQCWEIEIRDTLSTKGLKATFDLVQKRYAEDPAFRKNCHDAMHVVGSASYATFAKDRTVLSRPETAYCGYGFYHGFMEAMLTAEGPMHYAKVTAYCEALKRSPDGRYGPCYHGIGHALFDSLEGSTYGNAKEMVGDALSSCEVALPEDTDRASCAGGVFNSFANAMSWHTYELSFTGYNVQKFCDSQKQNYRKSCYAETGIGFIRQQKMSRAQSLDFIRSLHDELMPYEVFIYFSDEVKRSIATLDMVRISADCKALNNELEVHACIEGVLEGLREETGPEQSYIMGFSFCHALTELPLVHYCYRDVRTRLTNTYVKTPAFKDACEALADRPAGLCPK